MTRPPADMPEPARTILDAVNRRDVHALGARMLPVVGAYGNDRALSISQSPRPSAPVFLLHGTEDKMVDVIHPRHTAAIVPGAELVLHEGHGHFSIDAFLIPSLSSVLSRP